MKGYEEFSEASKEIDRIIGDINELNFQLTEKLIKSRANILIRCVECGIPLTEVEIRDSVNNKLKLDEIVCNECFKKLVESDPREVRGI